MQDWRLEPAHDLGLPLGQQLRSPQREAGLPSAIAASVWSGLTGSYLRLYHRLNIEGQENLPTEGPFVLVANHSSHLDALVLAHGVPWRQRAEVYPIAAGDTFFSSPVKMLFSTLFMNALPIWRRAATLHNIEALRQRVQQHGVYILFPEGTRSRDGKMNPFKPGIGMLIAGTSVPIVPCHLTGGFAAMPHNRGIPRPVKLRMRIGTPLCFAEVPNARDGWLRVATQLQQAVEALAAK